MFAPDRPRIDRFVLRVLDARRAELRVCTAPPPVCCQDPHDFDIPDDSDLCDEPESPSSPQSWTTVIPIDALPQFTRDVLAVAASLYETEELDLSANDELEQLLRELRATTWTPEPGAALH